MPVLPRQINLESRNDGLQTTMGLMQVTKMKMRVKKFVKIELPQTINEKNVSKYYQKLAYFAKSYFQCFIIGRHYEINFIHKGQYRYK